MIPAYGMREQGGFGIRGFRMHCPSCGTLGPVKPNKMTVEKDAVRHRCEAARV